MDSLGQKLKAARERKRISQSNAAAGTRIKIQHIDAIEKDNFGILPAPAYAKGFVKMYAEFLGLDPAPFVKEFTQLHMPGSKATLITEPDAQPKVPTATRSPVIKSFETVDVPDPRHPMEELPDGAPAPRANLNVDWSGLAARFAAGFKQVPWRIVGMVAAVVIVIVLLSNLVTALVQRRAAQADETDPAPVARVDPLRLIREPSDPYLVPVNGEQKP